MELLPLSWKTLGTRSLRNFIAESYQPYYLPAREGKAQSRNEKHILSMSKKDKMAGGSPRRFCVSHSPFKGADYCGEKLGRGRVISGRLANRFGSRFGTNTKLLRGVIGPISSPSDYLDTACDDDDDDDDDDDAGAAETMPSHCPYGKSFNLCLLLVTFLSLRVESLFLQERNMLFVDRPIEQNNILLDD